MEGEGGVPDRRRVGVLSHTEDFLCVLVGGGNGGVCRPCRPRGRTGALGSRAVEGELGQCLRKTSSKRPRRFRLRT